jgi:uncharacterized protein (TIGR01244 family)
MVEKRLLAQDYFVCGQITTRDLVEAARLGVGLIICNRPDGEDSGQPSAADIAEQARALGMEFLHIPLSASGLTQLLIDQTRNVLTSQSTPILAYCRSGTRSTQLWALAQAMRGMPPAQIMATTAAAGYDVQALAPNLKAFYDYAQSLAEQSLDEHSLAEKAQD